MSSWPDSRDAAIPALLICPNQILATEVAPAFARTRAFEILAEIKAYPEPQTLEMRLRQLQPEVVLVDLTSGVAEALTLIERVTQVAPNAVVIGLHCANDSTVVLAALRAGAKDFLYSPFEPTIQVEAALRVRKLVGPPEQTRSHGRIIGVSSLKPGSGASTVALQLALSLRRVAANRVLLVDCDLVSGDIAFTLKLPSGYSLLDALARSDSMDAAAWSAVVSSAHGIDVLPAPDAPLDDLSAAGKLREVLEFARTLYDWIVLDLPIVLHRLSLSLLTETDHVLLASTPDLGSLHLGRRALSLLKELGIGPDRYSILINRHPKHSDVTVADVERIFGCSVLTSLPEDQGALDKAISRVETLPANSTLGIAVDKLSRRIPHVVTGPGPAANPAVSSG